MSNTSLWKSNSEITISKKEDISSVLDIAVQLKTSDRNQIVAAYESGNYQMLSNYVWNKTITAIKSQLAKMGGAFVGEMLDREDITDFTNLQHVITDFDALQLAKDLGLISNKSAFRLKQSMDLISHFNEAEEESEENEEDIEESFTKLDAQTVLVSCIQSILGQHKVEFSLNFMEFRDSLEESTLTDEDNNVKKLLKAPYFFKRATLRILLSMIKTKQSAQLENSLANVNLIIPKIWTDFKLPEKWQIGKTYAEVYTEGKSTAVSGLKKLLLKVKGFDYVPEDLRSNAFIKAANDIIGAHEGSNNFYYEASAVRALANMGSVIPIPALPLSISATLCVKLGNQWGNSWEAQGPANDILKNVTKDRWLYYFDECLLTDHRVLYKLLQSKPLSRWMDFIGGLKDMNLIVESIKDPNVKNLLKASLAAKSLGVVKAVNAIVEEYDT